MESGREGIEVLKRWGVNEITLLNYPKKVESVHVIVGVIPMLHSHTWSRPEYTSYLY